MMSSQYRLKLQQPQVASTTCKANMSSADVSGSCSSSMTQLLRLCVTHLKSDMIGVGHDHQT
jgi:hypothetical protein